MNWIKNFKGWQRIVEANEVPDWSWNTRLKPALKEAAEGNPLMVYFTGGDECSWCTKLENEVFRRVDFVTWADRRKVVGLKVKWSPGEEEFDRLQYHIEEELGLKLSGSPTIVFLTVNSSYKLNRVESPDAKEFREGYDDNWIKIVGVSSSNFKIPPKKGEVLAHSSAKNRYEFVQFSGIDGYMLIRPTGTLKNKNYIEDLSVPNRGLVDEPGGKISAVGTAVLNSIITLNQDNIFPYDSEFLTHAQKREFLRKTRTLTGVSLKGGTENSSLGYLEGGPKMWCYQADIILGFEKESASQDISDRFKRIGAYTGTCADDPDLTLKSQWNKIKDGKYYELQADETKDGGWSKAKAESLGAEVVSGNRIAFINDIGDFFTISWVDVTRMEKCYGYVPIVHDWAGLNSGPTGDTNEYSRTADTYFYRKKGEAGGWKKITDPAEKTRVSQLVGWNKRTFSIRKPKSTQSI